MNNLSNYQKSGDDTALNGIELTCADGEVITSLIGPWGKWGGRVTCQAGKFVKGAKIRDEYNQRRGDDTAANGLKFECTDGQILSPGDGFWGSWSSMKTCPEGEVVYGIKTSVQPKKGEGDDTALNSVNFLCRKMGKDMIKVLLVHKCVQVWNKRNKIMKILDITITC